MWQSMMGRGGTPLPSARPFAAARTPHSRNLEGAALFGEGDGFLDAGAGAEMVEGFIVCCTEAGGGAWRNQTSASGRSVACCPAGPAQCGCSCTDWCGDTRRGRASRAPHEDKRRVHRWAPSPAPVLPPSVHRRRTCWPPPYVVSCSPSSPRRTSRPRATCAPLPGLQARGEQGSEALRPRRRRLMGEREAPGEEWLSDGAQAQRVPRTPEDTSRGEGDPGWSLVCSPCPDTVAVSTVHDACDVHWHTDGRGVMPGHTRRAGRPHASPPCVRRCREMARLLCGGPGPLITSQGSGDRAPDAAAEHHGA